MTLAYNGPEPFYMDSTSDRSTVLELRLSGPEQVQWVNTATTPARLIAAVQMEVVNMPELSSALKEGLYQVLQNPKKITVQNEGQDNLIRIELNHLKDPLPEDRWVHLTVSLTHLDNKNKVDSLPIPTVLQRPAFPGLAALDFGTTNSAIAYYGATFPVYPIQGALSTSQYKSLEDLLESLMQELEQQTLNEPSFQPLSVRLIETARQLWTKQGFRGRTIDEVRKYFNELAKRESPNDLRNMRVKLLVAWGTNNYGGFLKQHPKQALFLANRYYQYLNNIIDRDLQEDIGIFLPELEKKQKTGILTSTIRMTELVPVRPEKSSSETFPTIDGLKSADKIEMHAGVLDQAAKDNKDRATPPNSSVQQNRSINPYLATHVGYVTGTKRWLGQSNHQAYFIDMKGLTFKDSYNPLCTAAIKYLLARTEQSIANGDPRRLDNLVVTYPANFSQERRQHLQQLVKRLGVTQVEMSFDEATAGALYYAYRELFTDLFTGINGFLAGSHQRSDKVISKVTDQLEDMTVYYQNFLIYDIGGGTTDIALLEIGVVEETHHLLSPAETHNAGRCFVIHPKLLGLTGNENFAGDNITLAVFRILKSKLATHVATLMLDKKEQQPEAIQRVLEQFGEHKTGDEYTLFTQWLSKTTGWQALSSEVKEALHTLIPTRFENHPELRGAFFLLWQEAEDIKQRLSPSPKSETEIPHPEFAYAQGKSLLPAIQHLNLGLQEHQLAQVIQVRAEEMEQVIREDLRKTFEKALNLCLDSNETALKFLIDKVILAGNSANLRLIREELPIKVLGTPSKNNLPAAFKPERQALVFEPNQAKLAVARGACLSHFFKTTNPSPKYRETPQILKKGKDVIVFNIDNLRNYVPFSLKANIGVGEPLLVFAAGEMMRGETRGCQGGKVAREPISYTPVVNCYQVDKKGHDPDATGKPPYCQFKVQEAVAKYARENYPHLQSDRELEDLVRDFPFYLEMDGERQVTCWMYPFSPSEAELKKKELADKTKMSVALEALCEKNAEGKWVWKSQPTLVFPAGAGGNDSVIFKKSPAFAASTRYGKIPMRGSVCLFSPTDQTMLWEVNLPSTQVKNPELAELQVFLELQNNEVVFKYTVYDPDFQDDPRWVKIPTSEPTKEQAPFNPFSGKE